MDDATRQAVRGMQTIVLAIAGGMVLFAALAMVLTTQGVMPADPAAESVEFLRQVFGWVLAALALLQPIAYSGVRQANLRRLREELRREEGATPSPERVVPVYRTLTIIAVALAEGWGLLGTIALLITGEQLFLVAPALALGLMALVHPTEGRLERFVASLREW